MLDSTLEIAFKEYLINDSGTRYNDTNLEAVMASRTSLHNEIKKKIRINATIWKKIEYYYNLRSELIHKRASVSISDDQLNDFRETTEYVLNVLFSLDFII